MKTIEQFYDQIAASKELSDKLHSIKSGQQIVEFLKENEVDCTAEQFMTFLLEKVHQDGEIPEDELEAIAGGKLVFWDENNQPKLFAYLPCILY